MAQNKTQLTRADVLAFIDTVSHPVRKRDALTLLDMHRAVTGLEAEMWGPTLIGFGRYHYRYDSGREGDFFRAGFSPRKAQSVVYVIPGYEAYDALLARLGPHKLGKSCLYITDLEKVDRTVLETLVRTGFEEMNQRYPA